MDQMTDQQISPSSGAAVNKKYMENNLIFDVT